MIKKESKSDSLSVFMKERLLALIEVALILESLLSFSPNNCPKFEIRLLSLSDTCRREPNKVHSFELQGKRSEQLKILTRNGWIEVQEIIHGFSDKIKKYIGRLAAKYIYTS